MPVRMQDILPAAAETDMTTGEAVHRTASPSLDSVLRIPGPAEGLRASTLAWLQGCSFEFTDSIALAASDTQRAALGRVWPITPAVLIEDIVAEIIQEAHDAANPWARDFRLVQDQTLPEEERLGA
jgi:hypothetical protein